MYKSRKVPTSRLSRFSKLGGLALKVAGNVVLEGSKQISRGKSTNMRDLLITPKNLMALTEKLSHMRGAAMKMGQMLSMDAGDILPEELSDILARLRADAAPMPHSQLISVLEANYGKEWIDRFAHFNLRPFASASIGQVHEAYKLNGEKLAVKVQYPGIRDSIHSDVDNVGTLLKLSGLIPDSVNLQPLLDEAKKQLLNEADYLIEASYLQQFAQKSENDKFIIPGWFEEVTTKDMLVMEYVEGVPIEHSSELDQHTRNNIATNLLSLFFKELFDLKLMQTDPNFANYQYQPASKKIVLLDFGATREIPDELSKKYRSLFAACVFNDTNQIITSAKAIGFFNDNISDSYLDKIVSIFQIAAEPLHYDGVYDFAENSQAKRIKDIALSIKRHKSEWHSPPIDSMFIHRKLAGLYLLFSKLKAKVEVKSLIAKYIED